MRRSDLLPHFARTTPPSVSRSLFPTSRCRFHQPPTTTQVASSTEKHQPHASISQNHPFHFETGLALSAKRYPRPFPPPFLSPPSGSFSDPLSTHHRSRDRRAFVNGELIRGYTNGDDAVYAGNYFVAVNDGVGAWSTREGGHAGLWSRLIIHFWALGIENDMSEARPDGEPYEPRPVEYLQRAYEQTIEATTTPTQWLGTTTAAGAQLHYEPAGAAPADAVRPVLYVTNLGDSEILVIRPREGKVVYRTQPQWHWFDCPRQLGTNSPDTPRKNAVTDRVQIEENDVVLAVSDGVIDNLWEHEIVSNVVRSIGEWEVGGAGVRAKARKYGGAGGMSFVAEQLMNAARVISQDPFAESPFMERAIEEGLAMEGGKPDDISVVAALTKRSRPG